MLIAESSSSSPMPSQISLMPYMSGMHRLPWSLFYVDSAQSLLKGLICSQADTLYSSKHLCFQEPFVYFLVLLNWGRGEERERDRYQFVIPLLYALISHYVFAIIPTRKLGAFKENTFICAKSDIKQNKTKKRYRDIWQFKKAENQRTWHSWTTNKKLLKSYQGKDECGF